VLSYWLRFIRASRRKRRPRDEYIRTILSPNSWGGAIDLTILAAHYGTEIASIDVETGRIDRFGPSDGGCGRLGEPRVAHILRDPLRRRGPGSCARGAPGILREHRPRERVLEALRALAAKLRAKRAYTNTATFDLKCEVRIPFLAVSC
jgi:ubiquitin thioesterase OTU1